MSLDLERLCAHEAEYFTMAATLEKQAHAWFLRADAMPDYRDANHALHLRDTGAGADWVAGEVARYYRELGRRIVADVDPIAEAQGIGAALRRLGVMPVFGAMTAMTYAKIELPEPPQNGVRVERIERGSPLVERWVQIFVEDEEPEAQAMWALVARCEAEFPAAQIYLAFWEEEPVGGCSLLSFGGWGRIESVMTRERFRRRGVATSVVSAAIADSRQKGDTLTYLFAEEGGAGEAVYRKMGFESLGRSPLRRHMER